MPRMPFWRIDYFELKVTEKQQMQEELCPPLFIKQGINFPLEGGSHLPHLLS